MRRSSGTRAGIAAPLRSMICSHTEAASFTSVSETDSGDLTLQDSGLNSVDQMTIKRQTELVSESVSQLASYSDS